MPNTSGILRVSKRIAYIAFPLTILYLAHSGSRYVKQPLVKQPAKPLVIKPAKPVATQPPDVLVIKPAKNVKRVYKIYSWTSTIWGKNFLGLGTEAFNYCEFSNCIAVPRKEAEFNSSDVVLFHMRYIKKQPLPKYRPKHQMWIASIHESPAYESAWLDYSKYNGMFNATWTYHKKSDIWTNYSLSVFVKKTADEIPKTPKINYAAGRTKPIAWIVSHCSTVGRREFYIKHLQKHINVDAIGECGKIKCPRDKHADCLAMLRKNYKFYLAFENSICDEYSTEKYWNAVNSDVVPIVMSGFNYSAFAPPMSYIDIKDYDSPQALAEHLHRLDKDDSLYNKYFEWKKHYKLAYALERTECKVCKYINKAIKTTKVYDRLDLFWNNKTDCHPVESYYKNIDKKYWN